MPKLQVGAVSYLNTKPLLWGIERSALRSEMDLHLLYPAQLAAGLRNGSLDLALMPVAALPTIPGARIEGDYGIGADGPVASVCLFSEVPMEEIERVYLDYQSRTSIRLAQWLMERYWKRSVRYVAASEDYITRIGGTAAGVIIGDRALEALDKFPFVYDLAEGWKAATGLPFVFAGWTATKELPQEFLDAFSAANAAGLQHVDEIVAVNPFSAYDLRRYYTHNIQYRLDTRMMMGLERFLQEVSTLSGSGGHPE